ncbi:hypothetical protein O0L34_g16803 [Tuta absoluta]|nr:hypothetical protein O0L34_g16803 [Tuta absoluta]
MTRDSHVPSKRPRVPAATCHGPPHRWRRGALTETPPLWLQRVSVYDTRLTCPQQAAACTGCHMSWSTTSLEARCSNRNSTTLVTEGVSIRHETHMSPASGRVYRLPHVMVHHIAGGAVL